MYRLLIIVMTIALAGLGANAQTQHGHAAASSLTQASPTDTLTSPDPQDASLTYDYFFLEAMVQRQKGNADAAFDLLTHCTALNPEAPEAHFFLAEYYTALKNQEQAMACIKRAAELDPDNVTYMETLVQAYIGSQQYEEAAMVTEQLYESHKDRTDLLETLYELYRQQERYSDAIGALERIEAIDGRNERTAYYKSRLYIEMGDKAAAVEEMKALTTEFPYDLNCKGAYGDMLMMSEEYDQAYKVYQQILREDPKNTRAQTSLATYFLAKGDTEKADSMRQAVLLNTNTSTEQKVYLIRKAIQENEQLSGDSTKVLRLFQKMMAQPKPDTDIAGLFVAYMELKKMPKDSIVPVLEQIIAMAPDNAAARLQLVSYAWQDEDHQRVIDLCRAARQYNPEEMAFYYYQGMAYYQKDDKDQALSAFQNGIGVINDESNPAIVADFYAVMGDLLHQKGLARQAFEAYDSCLMHAPDNMMCLNNYAYYLSELGEQLDKAEQMSYKTVKAEPANPTYLDTYAWILFMQKRYAEAKVYIEQAMKFDTDSSAVITEHGGDIMMMAGNAEQALALWKEALKINTQNKKLIRKIKLKKYLK